MQVPVVGDDGGDDGVGPLHPAPAGQPPGGLRHYPGGGGAGGGGGVGGVVGWRLRMGRDFVKIKELKDG